MLEGRGAAAGSLDCWIFPPPPPQPLPFPREDSVAAAAAVASVKHLALHPQRKLERFVAAGRC